MKLRVILGSSNVTGAGYDAERRVLRVVFGSTAYDYTDAGPDVFEGLVNTLSPGGYMRSVVMPNHVAQRVDELLEWTDEAW